MKAYITILKVLFQLNIVFWALCATFVSCGPSFEERAMKEFQEEQAKKKDKDSTYYNESVFIIDDIRPDQFSDFKQYHANMLDNTTLGSAEFWFRAKSNKFRIGDPLVLTIRTISEKDTIAPKPKITTINKISK